MLCESNAFGWLRFPWKRIGIFVSNDIKSVREKKKSSTELLVATRHKIHREEVCSNLLFTPFNQLKVPKQFFNKNLDSMVRKIISKQWIEFFRCELENEKPQEDAGLAYFTDVLRCVTGWRRSQEFTVNIANKNMTGSGQCSEELIRVMLPRVELRIPDGGRVRDGGYLSRFSKCAY